MASPNAARALDETPDKENNRNRGNKGGRKKGAKNNKQVETMEVVTGRYPHRRGSSSSGVSHGKRRPSSTSTKVCVAKDGTRAARMAC